MILKLAFPGKHTWPFSSWQGFKSQSWNDRSKTWETQSTFSQLVDWANKLTQANLLKAPLETLLCTYLVITENYRPEIGLLLKGSHHDLNLGDGLCFPKHSHACFPIWSFPEWVGLGIQFHDSLCVASCPFLPFWRASQSPAVPTR